MARDAAEQRATGSTFTMGGATFQLIESPEERGDDSAVVLMTMPPEQGKFLAPDHRHPTREKVEVQAGRAGVSHGYGDAMEDAQLNPGESVTLGAGEWHGIRNLSATEDVVIRLTHTPGDQWAALVREGAELERAGEVPGSFMGKFMEVIKIEFRPAASRG